MTNPFFKKSYVSIDQIRTRSEVELLFSEADKMRQTMAQGKLEEPLKGKMVAILFYQPSTRTFSSFSAAARRLGAYTVAIHEMEHFSSVSKGESLEDTIRSIYQTTGAEAIVMRHPDDNSAEVAAKVSPVPIINAGSGTKEHPTQALLDMYTIYEHLGRMDNLNVAMVGDLLYGRTIKSLAKLLAVVGKKNAVTLVAPDELKAPPALVKELKRKGVSVVEKDRLDGFLGEVDVVYMTRVQKEWFEAAGKMEEYDRLKLRFVLDEKLVNKMRKKAIVMHPLPRVGEIMREVDSNPRAKYFEQMRSGLYTRMALLKLVLQK